MLQALPILMLLALMTGQICPMHSTGGSMEPTMSGLVISMGISTKITGIRRGDIVSARKADGTMIIKRVIGQPGDRVTTIDGCRFYVNGKPELWDPVECTATQYAGMTWELHADQYFLAGDNRNVSLDSRAYGPVATDNITYLIRR